MSNKRLLKELKDLSTAPKEWFTVETKDENLYQWKATVNGPEKTPYEGGVFKLEFEIPAEYPFKPPKVS
jgi:ubiquitin-protein ligase